MAAVTRLFTDTELTRRRLLGLTASAVAGLTSGVPAAAHTSNGVIPVTGVPKSGLEPFDELMTSFVQEQKAPGASLAVSRNGKLVYARGFGYADVENKKPVEPAALFRIASVSKPITAVAVMQLVEKGKLKLDDRVMDRMELSPFTSPGAKPDPRWRQITIRQCLQHTAGWDRSKSYDPIGKPWQIAKALGIQPPVTPVHIVRYMMGQPLDFDPGERHAYSNLGYLVLARIIESVTGQKYEAYVKKEILAPIGVTTMQLGRALIENRAEGEVTYYDAKRRMGPALYSPRLGQQVPIQYGGENFEAFEAHGGWIASATDLVQFAAALDEPSKCGILQAETIEEMWARPQGAAGTEADGRPRAAFYACGWSVRPVGHAGKANTWHAGYIAGTESLLVRRWDGLNWAALFNTANNPGGTSLVGLIDGRLHEAADKVVGWDKIAKRAPAHRRRDRRT